MSEVTSLPSSLIILKHSIIKGRVPTSSNLEVGELALSLFPGEETIWAKNSEGNIVNMRSPRHDLMWGDIFKKYDTKENFEKDLSEGLVVNTAIVFIEDTKQLWTGGNYYSSHYTSEELDNILASKIVSIPEEVYNLNNSSTSDDISNAFGGIDSYKKLLDKSAGRGMVSAITFPGGGSIPVSVIPRNNSLRLEWVADGQYITVIINLTNETFSINKTLVDLINVGELENRVSTLEGKIDDLEYGGIMWNDVR